MVTAYMSFGKYRGRRLADIPTAYLRWLLREADIDDDLAEAVADEVGRRRPGRRTAGAMVDVAAVLQRWYREAAMRWHPDRGGSNQAMAAITAEYERLQELFGGAA